MRIVQYIGLKIRQSVLQVSWNERKNTMGSLISLKLILLSFLVTNYLRYKVINLKGSQI